MTQPVRIGDAAAALGLATHGLRHWEDVGVLVPARSSSGHRVYDEERLARARLIQVCQRAGLSLNEIRHLGTAVQPDRINLIQEKRADIATRMAALSRADGFLKHVLECRHPMVSECPDCATFSSA